MPAMWSGKGTPARSSPFAAREKPTPLSMRTSRENVRMDALRGQILEFQNVEAGLRIERVQAAHLRWTVMVTSFLGLGLGVGVFLALFTRYQR